MYFWKINNLKKDLIEKPLSEGEQFKYFLGGIVAISSIIAMTAFIENNIWDKYFVLVGCIIKIIGTVYIYKMNGGSEGKYILQRIFSLSWVMGIRWMVLLVLPTTAVFFTLLGGIPGKTALYDVVVFNFIYLIYFWLLGRHIKEVSLKSVKEE